MSATITGITQTPSGWSLAFTGGPVDVYLRGEILARNVTDSPYVVADGLEAGSPDVVIQDAGSQPPLGNACVALQWRFVTGADGYNVYKDSVLVGNVPAKSTDGYLRWKSGIQQDGATGVYSVAAKKGTAESALVSVSTKIIRNPRLPVCRASVATVEGVTILTIDENPMAGF